MLPARGELLFSRAPNTRELVAATSRMVHRSVPRVFLPDKLWRITPSNSDLANSAYLRYLLSHRQFRERLAAQATGTLGGSMLNVSQEKLLRPRTAVATTARPTEHLQRHRLERDRHTGEKMTKSMRAHRPAAPIHRAELVQGFTSALQSYWSPRSVESFARMSICGSRATSLYLNALESTDRDPVLGRRFHLSFGDNASASRHCGLSLGLIVFLRLRGRSLLGANKACVFHLAGGCSRHFP